MSANVYINLAKKHLEFAEDCKQQLAFYSTNIDKFIEQGQIAKAELLLALGKKTAARMERHIKEADHLLALAEETR